MEGNGTDLKQNPTLVWIFEITGPSQLDADGLPDFNSFLPSVTFP